MSLIEKIWYQKSWISISLLPLSLLFSFISLCRQYLYRIGLKKTTQLSCPVIVVGNITVGGTGKTPLVIALADFLRGKGYMPGIISRGYPNCHRFPQWVTPQSDPNTVGDESVLLARRTGCPVVVCRSRVAAADFLLKHSDCTIILSDDGLQHFALGRTIEIVLIDGNRQFGNGFLLPAGPLREPKARLRQVDFCLINGTSRERFQKNQFEMQLLPLGCIPVGLQDARLGAEVTRDLDFVDLKNPKEYSLYFEGFSDQQNSKVDVRSDAQSRILKSNGYTNLMGSQRINLPDGLAGKIVHAVAGIGHPDRFFESLRALGLSFIEHVFADHYAFTIQDFAFLQQDAVVVMTEKDAVKCGAFADERYWYVPVDAKIDPDFFMKISQILLHD